MRGGLRSGRTPRDRHSQSDKSRPPGSAGQQFLARPLEGGKAWGPLGKLLRALAGSQMDGSCMNAAARTVAFGYWFLAHLSLVSGFLCISTSQMYACAQKYSHANTTPEWPIPRPPQRSLELSLHRYVSARCHTYSATYPPILTSLPPAED
jgi:hypothetical protein